MAFPTVMPAFFVENSWSFLFYAVIIAIIVLLRHKIEWQVFGIGLYKTKVGLKLMEKMGTKYRGLVQLLGYIGLGVGFVGMGFIVFTLLSGLWNLMFNPAAPAVISPILPGFHIPGTDLKVPLITGWLALFIVVVIHEFSHGVVSRAHNVPVKSSGLLIFGPIGGAFVEPDEKTLAKQPETVKYSLFAAGPFSNIVTGLLFALFSAFVILPLLVFMTMPAGVEITSVVPDYPAANASLGAGMIITGINGAAVVDNAQLSAQLDKVRAGDSLLITVEKSDGGVAEYSVLTTQNPNDATSTKGYVGINLLAKRDPKVDAVWYQGLIITLRWLQEFFKWLLILSLGLGLANLLPIGPVDGGQMLRQACYQVTGDSKKGGKGDWWWAKISWVTLAIIIVLLIIPIAKAIL